nr:EOG090X0A90 [Polyphemus pediculus]
MSHQTGIRANEELIKFFGKCRDGVIRVFRVSITNEELALNEFAKTRSNWEEDFDSLIPHLLEENQPAFLLFRLDSQNSLGYEWLLITWIPENAPVREKMIYASTKATLKSQFGSGQIKEDYLGTVLEDVTLKGYFKQKQNAASPAPLTQAEEELALVKKTEINAHISIDSKHQTLSGVAFPVSEVALRALFDFRQKQHNYIQLSIDLVKELVNLETLETINVANLTTKVPEDQGRYHLFRFPHTHEGDYLESIIFIYSMPGYACSIRERMLYSSCKGPITDLLENKLIINVANKLSITIDKKIEIETGGELSEDYLMDELHPKKNIYQPKFEKPKGPPNRGARRLTSKKPEES